MPPLPADSIHARACKLKCEKILTRPGKGADPGAGGPGPGGKRPGGKQVGAGGFT